MNRSSKNFSILAILLPIIALYINVVSSAKCHKDSVGGEICTMHPKDFNPSQIAIAEEEVRCKVGYLESMSSKEVTNYLENEKRMVTIVIGTSGYYLTDGHHLSKAVYDADIDEDLKVIYCLVTDNWSGYSQDDFWLNMINNNYIWLYDEKGYAPISPEIFPDELGGMLNDPYRALAWMLCDAGAWGKNGTPFEDFLWANFLRSNIPLAAINSISNSNLNENSKLSLNKNKNHKIHDKVHKNGKGQQFFTWCEVNPYSESCLPDETQSLKKALPLAIKLASSPIAEHMPGFGQGVAKPPKCGGNSTSYTTLTDYLDSQNIKYSLEEDDDEI